jgi:hypothetical protein
MNCVELEINLLRRICCGDEQAMDFLAHFWAPYVHGIDDIIDGDKKSAEEILAVFALAATLYSHPFYLKHLEALRQHIIVCTNIYADSVAWENSPIPWQREWADHNRHVGMEMVICVASICGGYRHARLISQEQRAVCWDEHHRQGVAV